ncbi:MAG: GNAT family protein [bacterium]|nr:GNAT family protein [bacterium]
MEEKIVYRGKTKKGNNIIIRYPNKDDARAMCDYINILSHEQTFIRFQGEEVSLENEVKYLNSQLEKIEKKQAVQLLVFCDKLLIGISGIDMKDKTESHEGLFGISIAKEFRREGIGKKLMELVIEEAKNNLSQLKIITLGVFGNNPLAIAIYKKFGFKEFGTLPEGILYKEKYIDHIYMYKKV